jgi:hypothetical protein
MCNDFMLGDQVVHETLDGETVVINLASGTYYSLEGSAADLWSRLLAGETPAESAATLAAQHGGDATAVTGAIVAFQQQLFDQGLITAQPVAAPMAGGDLGTFEVPRLRIYDDLREHLLLDPVHDVEHGSGWPAVSAGP